MTTSGNRFDSESGVYSVLYFGSTLEVCFGETLSRFRPSSYLLSEVGDEWRRLGFMDVGAVPVEWRNRRSAVHVALPESYRFLDIEAPATHQFLTSTLAPGLSALGYEEIDVGVVRGGDRRVTRMISDWAYRQRNEVDEARFAGLRYLSRVNTNWECWAVFDDVAFEVLETRPITQEMPELQQVAKMFDLVVH